ncbi:TPA: DUF927 domain-containing protein [Klebsiella aerogenes]|uniref:DUF927 domain-containing protein n=1 Tax=Klebsiella aerogenes TaxID=548 RepID=UPI00049FBD6F|nr:DUF927 domain-containing protein [Klebsiella aerogenes]EKU4981800.1 DUF927 domain-containing protein [Klebsiella aerogenes]KDF30700.1 hypothetical protein AE04_02821 [Klebsiella aerogenes MGH 78]KZQ56431.1 hypothetical protein A3N61_16320 [Klebsiella aerogenes]HBV6024609.1 DUF927 domain-containing protein [Klebsiella aerogenes]HBZ8411365.1 DUF927 domain-containing protein [Klebsiella aerogenes]
MKRAPFLCKQSPDRTLEVVILAGSLSWETSRAWRKDPDREDDVPPVVLGPDELADLDNLTIIRPDALYVRVLRTGDIREEELLKIAVKLAHAGVQMARLMTPDGELLENWTGQLERLRQERPSDILPDHFRLDEEALWFDKLTERRDGESDVQPQRICSPLRVTAITCDSHDGSYGRLLEWHTTTGQLRRWAMPMAMLSGNGEELRRILLENGLTYISTRPALRSLLCEYISRSLPGRRVTCVEKTGWHCGVYVLPDEVIGPGGDNVILQGSHYLTGGFAQAGTLAEWQEQVAALCAGNSRLVFAICCALAAPLLRLTGTGGGGFHLRGESTDGKTTVMKVAASVCGGTDYWHSWRATGNALEGIASRHNDALLPLDELREVDPREAGMIAYMLANGQGKGRARTDGEVRNRRHWTLLLFSTGELSLAEHTERAGERLYAGMDVRMVQIPSDTGQHGAFEQLHGFASGQQFADALCDRVDLFHGTAFRAWLAFLTHDLDASTTLARKLLRRYQTALMPENAGNQVQRIVARFALLAVAGEMATLQGITGWQEGTAYGAVQICLHAWLNERGHIANQEDEGVLAQIKRFITAHQYSRFASWDGPDRPLNMVGFRRVEKDPLTGEEHTLFHILPEGWREMCRGFSPARAARLCLEAECLLPGSDGKYQSQVRLPEIGKARVYRLTSRILSV